MSLRLPYWTIAPEAVKRMMAVNSYLVRSALEPSLRHLIWLRVSQINGCAYCVDLHAHAASISCPVYRLAIGQVSMVPSLTATAPPLIAAPVSRRLE